MHILVIYLHDCDDMQKTAMTATDKAFGEGRVRSESLEDLGNFNIVRICVPE